MMCELRDVAIPSPPPTGIQCRVSPSPLLDHAHHLEDVVNDKEEEGEEAPDKILRSSFNRFTRHLVLALKISRVAPGNNANTRRERGSPILRWCEWTQGDHTHSRQEPEQGVEHDGRLRFNIGECLIGLMIVWSWRYARPTRGSGTGI